MHIAQLVLGIGHAQPRDVAARAHRPLDARPFAGLELQAQTERVRNRQDVGEQNRRIERVARERLQSDLARELRRHAELQEAAGARARRAVLRQIAAGLTHHPDGRAVDGLSQQRAQQQIVLRAIAVGFSSTSLLNFVSPDRTTAHVP